MFGRGDVVSDVRGTCCAAGARRRAAVMLASIALALAVHTSTAAATTATPTPLVPTVVASATPTEPARTTMIRGQVFEAVGGAGLAGAVVEYHVAGRGTGMVTTDDSGAFAFTLELRDSDWVVIDVAATGYFPDGTAQTGAELRANPVLVFRLQPRVDVQIAGLVFDASRGTSAGIAGAQVEYTLDHGRGRAATDAGGRFTLLLSLPENDYLAVWVSAEGFRPTLETYRAGDLWNERSIAIGLNPAAARTETEIGGLVYDASVGVGAPISGATVDYVYHNAEDAFPDVSGSVQTGADGRYRFDLLLGPNDYVELTIAATGFATFSTFLSAYAAGTPADFALAPIGGDVLIAPSDMNLECTTTFDVTVSNPTDETLVILSLDFHFHYGSGVYGTDFTWDLGELEFPLQLAAGEQFTFPVTFHAGGRFPSLLTITVISGARGGPRSVYYFGHNDACHPTCAGDCDRDGVVTVSELVRAVSMALDGGAPDACVAADSNADFIISIADLVLAVRSALEGCPPGVTPSPSPPFVSTPTSTPTPTGTPTPDAVGVLQGVIEYECYINGPGTTDASARATEQGYTLHCLPGPGHETHADLIRHADVQSASAQFAAASEPGDAWSFHDVPAAFWEIPFGPYDGADRYFVWQLDCWVVTVHSFDDTHFLITPQPLALSDAIFAAAADLLRAECPASP